MYSVTKSYRNFPAAHRQPGHDGHCRWIHGHNWGFDIVFTCQELDSNGFVIDVGKLDWVRQFLKHTFDHTLLLNEDDPHLAMLQGCLYGDCPETDHLAEIVVVQNCGMEGLARHVFIAVNRILLAEFKRGLRVLRVTCWEDSKNSATYEPQ